MAILVKSVQTSVPTVHSHVDYETMSDAKGFYSESDIWLNIYTGEGYLFHSPTSYTPHTSLNLRGDCDASTKITDVIKSNDGVCADPLTLLCSPLVSGGMLCDEPGLG